MPGLEPNDLLLFARVADEGSFTRAAERLGLPKSTVSRRLAALEAQLGERLLLRTTRKLSVTDFGRSVLEHAHQVVAEVEAATQLAQYRQIQPSGRLRVSMPGDFATLVIGAVLADFIAKFPAISLEIDLSPRRVDLIGENFDVAIRMGDLPDDATLAARRLAVFSASLYAAPHYLARRGVPSEPEALMEHDALRLLLRTGEPMTWVLNRGDAALGRHSSRPRDRQFAGTADPAGAVRCWHFHSERSLRGALHPQRRTGPGAGRLERAARAGLGGLSRPAADAGPHARLPGRAPGGVLRSALPGRTGAGRSDEREVRARKGTTTPRAA